MIKTILFVVCGQVQGVGFRYSARSSATAMGLTGWVRNKSNGDVEGIVQGTEESLEKFQAWLWQGPSCATVTNVKCKMIMREQIGDFQITQ
jgi:acylphosphatase